MISFDPHSHDAMMATVIAKLNEVSASVKRIEQTLSERLTKVEVREEERDKDVDSLKIWRAEINGKIVIISLIVSGVGTTLGSIIVAIISKYVHP